MKTKLLSVALLSTVLLASCGPSAPSSSTSPAGSSASAPEESQTTPDSSSAAPSSESSSSVAPVSNVFNASAFTNALLAELNKYDEALTFDAIKTAVEAMGEEVDFDPVSDKKITEAIAVLILSYALKQTLPERIGARSFQGWYFDPAKVQIRSVNDDSKEGSVYKALEYLSTTGIFNVPGSTSLSGGKAYSLNNLNKILDRIHAYFGESLVDDFYSTVNHDYLYDDNKYHDAPSDGRKTWDETYDAEKLTNIYDSRLIPEEDIVDWALGIEDHVPAASQFIDTYCDWEDRVAGNAAGVVANIEKYLAATTAEEFIEVCRETAKTMGYCILWSESKANSVSYAGVPLLHVTSYNYTGTPAEAKSGRTESIERFKPIFQEVLGCNDEKALKLATDYSDFKIKMAELKNRDTVEDSLMILSENSEHIEKSPKLYFDATLSTGETLDHFFQTLGFETESVAFNSSRDIRAIINMLTDESLDLVKGMAVWQMLQHYTICLPDTEAVNKWAWKEGYGTNAATLWDDKLAFYTYGMKYLSGSFSNYFVGTEQFDHASNAVVGVVNKLKGALLERIDNADWLSQDAKDKATLKVNNLSYSIGGKNSDGTTLSFPAPAFKNKEHGGTLCDNIGLYEDNLLDAAATTCGKTGGKLSFSDYVAIQDPLTANAFYMPSFNGIDITLGFMACYSGAETADDQRLLEDYGWVVGHEISHGFDSNGIYYDEKGTYHEEGWFSPEDKDAYDARCINVADYYKGYEVMPERPTVGKTVLTEAIADINGLHIVMEAAKNIPNFDYNHFFVSNAKHYASYSSQYTYSGNLASDEHPFGRARVNLAFKTIDEWHTAFQTKEGDQMWVAPEDRISIW